MLQTRQKQLVFLQVEHSLLQPLCRQSGFYKKISTRLKRYNNKYLEQFSRKQFVAYSLFQEEDEIRRMLFSLFKRELKAFMPPVFHSSGNARELKCQAGFHKRHSTWKYYIYMYIPIRPNLTYIC